MTTRKRKRLGGEAAPLKRERKRLNGHAGVDDEDPLANLPKAVNPEPREGTIGLRKNTPLFASYKAEYVDEVRQLILHGATTRDIIVHFHITKKVLDMWCMYYPEFASAMTITRASALADQKVVRSLYEMTQTRTLKKQKVFVSEGQPVKVKYKEEVEPNINAIKFWLMNRDPGTWGKDPEGGAGGPDKVANQININMIRSMDSGQLQSTIALLKSIMTPNQDLKRLDSLDPSLTDAEIETIEEVKGEDQ